MHRLKRGLSSACGYTLIELLAIMSLSAILLTLSASALRNYWLNQTLVRAEADTLAQMRNLQERAVSESNPRVFGMRFTVGTSDWYVVRFDGKGATTTADDECTVLETHSFDGVDIQAADFAAAPVVTNTCATQLSAGSADRFVFFYPRGTATSGEITLHQPAVDRTRTIGVSPMTGRVEETS